jgi:tripartite-type tricarboxylate transporter receptor subunit TctC
VPGFEVDQWFGVITAAKVPPPIVDKLSVAIGEAVRAPDVAERFSADGSTPLGTSPKAFGAHIRMEVEAWRKLAKEANLQL